MISGSVPLQDGLFRYHVTLPRKWEKVWNAKQEKCWESDSLTLLAFKSTKIIYSMRATVIVEKNSDGTYSAFMEDDMADFGLAGYGDSAQEAIDDFYEAFEDTKKYLEENDKSIPSLEFSFLYDLQSFFSYFSYLNISKVGEKAGIGASLMRQYASGVAKAGQKQYDKIRNTIKEMAYELSIASI